MDWIGTARSAFPLCQNCVPNPSVEPAGRCCLSEKPIPQVVEKLESGDKRKEALERAVSVKGRCATKRCAPTSDAQLTLEHFGKAEAVCETGKA
jgi:hypothetical protein